MGSQTSAPRPLSGVSIEDHDVKKREKSPSRKMKNRHSVQSLLSTITRHHKGSTAHSSSSSTTQEVQPTQPSTRGSTLLAKGKEREGYATHEGGESQSQARARAAAAAPAGEQSDIAEMLDSEPPKSIMPSPATVPCQYRTGKTLGSGTYAIVKEAVHIKTGEYFACKVINKKLMEGREYMVRNEIAVLKRVSQGHRNIVTLHDYFETAHNLYLVFDLCTGGELFDRICAKGNYYEADAADLVRTVFKAVKWIHECGIVHRDLKPENLLFRTKKEDADIMIADFGLSRVLEEEKLQVLTEICGTPGYMAPEIFKKTGHGKPVDVWAMGVITYFLLCGYTPFDRDTQQEEMEAIIAGDYKFEPEEYWANVSSTARDFVTYCLTIDPAKRPTAEEALKHKWLADDSPHFVQNNEGRPADLLPHIKKQFDAKKTWKKAVFSITAVKRMASANAKTSHLSPAAQALAPHLEQYKEESEKEIIDEGNAVLHYGDGGENSPTSPKFKTKDQGDGLTDKLSKMSIDQLP